MLITDIKRNEGNNIGHVGLALISEMARVAVWIHWSTVLGLEKLRRSRSVKFSAHWSASCAKAKRISTMFVSTTATISSRPALALDAFLPPRFCGNGFSGSPWKLTLDAQLPRCSVELWKKTGMQPELIEMTRDDNKKEHWVRLDIDVSIFDNADTEKEGASATYDKRFGFAPIFAHLGGGWMVNGKLRPGSSHSSCEGTDEFILESLGYAKSMVDANVLVVADSGFDSKERLETLCSQSRTGFIIKHNLRREPVDGWLATAKEHAQKVENFATSREKGRIYRGFVMREIGKKKRAVRQIFEVTEVLSKDGVFMMIPEVRVCVLWTNLEFDADQALKLYRKRGTSEQHHGEFKTEMDMERLPSGKFAVNAAFLRLGMLVYNMLRVASVDLVVARMLGLKKANRRRTKTVMRSMMSICARITRHARKVILHVSCPEPWFKVVSDLFYRLKTA
jgi:hypothetical protein